MLKFNALSLYVLTSFYFRANALDYDFNIIVTRRKLGETRSKIVSLRTFYEGGAPPEVLARTPPPSFIDEALEHSAAEMRFTVAARVKVCGVWVCPLSTLVSKI